MVQWGEQWVLTWAEKDTEHWVAGTETTAQDRAAVLYWGVFRCAPSVEHTTTFLRKLRCRPTGVELKLFTYTDPTQNLSQHGDCLCVLKTKGNHEGNANAYQNTAHLFAKLEEGSKHPYLDYMNFWQVDYVYPPQQHRCRYNDHSTQANKSIILVKINRKQRKHCRHTATCCKNNMPKMLCMSNSRKVPEGQHDEKYG